MSTYHVANVSQTNNSILQNRVRQLTLQLNQAKLQLSETEQQNAFNAAAVKQYAAQLTANLTADTSLNLLTAIKDPNPTWESQQVNATELQLVKTVETVEDEQVDKWFLRIYFSKPFVYSYTQSEQDTTKISKKVGSLDFPLESATLTDDENISGLKNFNVVGTVPLQSQTKLFARQISTTLYTLGEAETYPVISIPSSGNATITSDIKFVAFPQN